MTITVRLIFWGLIGFVPNPEGHNGLTALLPNTKLAQQADNVSLSCMVSQHFGVVYLLDGECEGDCLRIPQNGLGDAIGMGFSNDIGKLLPLRWLLNGEDLDILGDEQSKVKFRKPLLGLARKIAPSSERQAGYFSWVQSMDVLTGGKAKVLNACLKTTHKKDEETCPLTARFNLQGGRVGACHLVHGEEAQPFRDAKRDVRIFDYEFPGRQPFPRAVADAVSVDLQIDGESALLLSKGLPWEERPTAWARLRPDKHGKLTLVVANFPSGSILNEEPQLAAHHHDSVGNCSARPHSDILFRLLDGNPEIHGIRRLNGNGTRRVSAGTCELEAVKLAEILSGAHEPPHSSTACDGGSIP